MNNFTPHDWYWFIGANVAQVYSSKASVRNYVPVADPAYVAWSAVPDNAAAHLATEAELGEMLYPFRLRPIPVGILAGYLDEQMRQIVLQPDFGVIVDVYREVLHPTPSEAQVKTRIRSLL